jgi:hypothetical protein
MTWRLIKHRSSFDLNTFCSHFSHYKTDTLQSRTKKTLCFYKTSPVHLNHPVYVNDFSWFVAMTTRPGMRMRIPADSVWGWIKYGLSNTVLWVLRQLTILLKHGIRVLHNAIPQMDDSAFTIKCPSSSRQPPLHSLPRNPTNRPK